MRILGVRGLAACAAFALLAGGACAGDSDGDTAARATTGPGDDSASSAGAPQGVELRAVGRFDSPLYLTQPPGERNRLFVVEKGGRVRVVRRGRILSRPFLDLSQEVSTGGEQGLLSIAFAPDYARSRRFYVNFTDRAGDTRVQEFRRARRSADRADRSTRREVLKVDQPFANHNGGLMKFGPDDLLYIALGDGGSGGDPMNNGQRLGTLLGKLLRIDPRRSGRRRYTVPRSNPFRGRSRARAEIYSYGLRNPWRFSFDRRTGDLTIGDVGQNEIEEIDFVARGRGRGANFGWARFEGSRRFSGGEAPGHVGPVIERNHGSDGYCSITGGYVVRDSSLPALEGRYVYGDFCNAEIRSARLTTGGATDDGPTGLRVDELASFGEDRAGRIYAVSLSGAVYRLVAR